MKKTSLVFLLMGSLLHTSIFAQPVTEENTSSPKQVVAQYFESLENGNFEKLMGLLADDIVWHQPGNSILSGTYEGKQAVGELFKRFMEISGGTFKIDAVNAIMENGNLVTATLRFSATRCRYITFSMEMNGVDLMRVEDGKIKEVFLFSENQKDEDDFWGVK